MLFSTRPRKSQLLFDTFVEREFEDGVIFTLCMHAPSAYHNVSTSENSNSLTSAMYDVHIQRPHTPSAEHTVSNSENNNIAYVAVNIVAQFANTGMPTSAATMKAIAVRIRPCRHNVLERMLKRSSSSGSNNFHFDSGREMSSRSNGNRGGWCSTKALEHQLVLVALSCDL